MLRGVHDSRWPMVMAIVGYWAIGAPVGVGARLLHARCAGRGLWIGLACGLAAVSLQLLRALARQGAARILLTAAACDERACEATIANRARGLTRSQPPP